MSIRIRKHKWLVIIVSLIIFYSLRQGWLDNLWRNLQTYQPGQYAITHFVDGDTIIVNMNGHDETIRFIGADTPETHKPNTPVQCYGPEASAYTKQRIGNKRVQLVSDPLSTDRDRYKRLLRYVYLPDGTNLNQELIAKGYAFYYPYFPFTKSLDFEQSEKSAIRSGLGLWSKCHPTPTDSGGFVSNPE